MNPLSPPSSAQRASSVTIRGEVQSDRTGPLTVEAVLLAPWGERVIGRTTASSGGRFDFEACWPTGEGTSDGHVFVRARCGARVAAISGGVAVTELAGDVIDAGTLVAGGPLRVTSVVRPAAPRGGPGHARSGRGGGADREGCGCQAGPEAPRPRDRLIRFRWVEGSRATRPRAIGSAGSRRGGGRDER